jgi:orotate phosphoribosyltransferase
MTKREIEELFKEIGMKQEGHFLLASGLHSSLYFEKFRLLERPDLLSLFCRDIAEHFEGHEVKRVAGPTTGGLVVAYEVARNLGIHWLAAERVNGKPPPLPVSEIQREASPKRGFRRGKEIEPGEKILVVDDVLTTGGSLCETMDAVHRVGGVVAGIGVLVDRRDEETQFDVPVFSIYRSKAITYPPETCPLCKGGVKLTKPGGSRENSE